jgi:hypothetical protein
MLAHSENSAALSDLEQLIRTEVVFLGDWQQFGRTSGTASVGSHGAGVYLVGPGTQETVITSPNHFAVIGLSQGVHLVVFTEIGTGRSFSAMTKHLLGTRIFGVDSDVGIICKRSGTPYMSLAASGVIINAVGGDDLLQADGWHIL